MANSNKPAGLVPVTTLTGAPYTGQGRQYFISSADVNAYYPGDVVTLSGNGDTTRGIPGVTLAAAGDAILGVFIAGGVFADGAGYANPADLDIAYIPAVKGGQNYYALIADDPSLIFEIQENNGTLTSANIGQNANIVVAAPATGVRVSGTQLDDTTVANTATLQLKLLGLKRSVNNAFGAQAKWWVKINNHQLAAGTGTAGV
jgi:hypothetical protein